MKLFKITWNNSTTPGLYSPLFLEAPNEIKALSKFITLYENSGAQVSPTNIELTQICKLAKIIKYEDK